ncbi:Protein SPT2-like protein [Nibea albiflora]|uniref:Protein SPT2-like protein n=1 Tax=Nibea albiflora TaxID=240163 RepID=A0ACB7FDP5_NIBAL|nr:Protein SPT2-like protein [Nibea albiflora]
MMDFDNILDIASQNQGVSGSQQKRYSLQAGPPKKDPKSKGVNPAAVQALLKKQFVETKKKEILHKKKKEELLAKRVELKSDRKARAMASRTKDNFRGYNGVPVVETPKKRRTKQEMLEERSMNDERFRNNSLDPEDDEDNYEYEQTDSEPDQEPEPLRPGKTTGVSGSKSSDKLSSKRNSGPPKPAPPPMNFADLLKLAEKKQFEPVELKSKAVKKEERLRTAEEIRELEMERKAKRPDKDRDSKAERERDSKSSSSSNRKGTLEREQKNCKPQKNSVEKPGLHSGSGKKSHQGHPSSKPQGGDRERERPKTSHSDRDKFKSGSSGSSGAINSKVPSKATSSQVLAKQMGSKPSSSHKSSTSSDLSFKKESSSLNQGRASGIPGTRPTGSTATGQKSQHGSSQQNRTSQGNSLKQGPIVGGLKSGKGEPLRPGNNSAVKSSGNSAMRPSSGGPPKAGSQPQARPGGTLQARPGGAPQARPGGAPQTRPGGTLQARPGGAPQARPGGRGMLAPSGGSGSRPPGVGPGSGGAVQGRPTGSIASGPGRPKCTVVSETISSKNVGGSRPGAPPRPGMQQRPGMAPRPGMPQRPGMPPRPGMAPRPMMNRPPGTMLPPITSAYKRRYEDEDEYDSEMDDFIDDGGEDQDQISRHIKEIFGYDRTRYKDESDYALKFMESSWRDLQKEEARSLKLAVQEDLEEEKREEDEMKRNAKRKRKN